MKTYYGFKCANYSEEPAWFHTAEAAQRFSDACGFTDNPIEATTDPNPADVLDTPDHPWHKS